MERVAQIFQIGFRALCIGCFHKRVGGNPGTRDTVIFIALASLDASCKVFQDRSSLS